MSACQFDAGVFALAGYVGRRLRDLAWSYRRATWRGRCLPNFIVIGAQKSGTSSLFAYLAQHSQLFPSCRKEVHYFDGGLDPKVETYALGRPWYQAHFPLRRELDASAKAFEASPLYLFNPITPRRIHKLLPDAKLIALLRNPVERAISHYFHEVRKGREVRPIDEALMDQEDELDRVVQTQSYKSDFFINKSYKSRGIYNRQLERYFEYFGRDQVLIVSSEDLFGKPSRTLAQVYNFLGVEPDSRMLDLTPRNVSTNRTRVGADMHAYLRDYFLPHNNDLYELAGHTFGWDNPTSMSDVPPQH
jgi:Sulfotransferase domain